MHSPRIVVSDIIVVVYSDLSHLPDPGLRITGPQREHAAAILRDAAADGRLTFDELEQRLPGVLSATVRADLYRPLADLVPQAELPVLMEAPVSGIAGPGMRWEEPLLIRANWKGYNRYAPWDVPPFIELIGTTMASFYLNFVGTKPLAPVIDMVITGSVRITLVLPDGWGADLQQLNVRSEGPNSGGILSKVPSRPAKDQPRLVIRGSGTGNVKVRNPNRFDDWKKRRHDHETAGEIGADPGAS